MQQLSPPHLSVQCLRVDVKTGDISEDFAYNSGRFIGLMEGFAGWYTV
jgi:hypothetical protein